MSQICDELHRWFNNRQRFRFPFDSAAIPRNGIYVLFEAGERAHGGDRIVRAGTHTGENQLCSRLKQHFVLENKDRSIFRKNIGRALLARNHDPYADQWESDLTSSLAKDQKAHLINPARQRQVERDVSKRIQDFFSFAVIEVANKADRLSLESRIISTISLCSECQPSTGWLGLSSPKNKICESGLWLVNELYKEPLTEEELQQLMSTH